LHSQRVALKYLESEVCVIINNKAKVSVIGSGITIIRDQNLKITNSNSETNSNTINNSNNCDNCDSDDNNQPKPSSACAPEQIESQVVTFATDVYRFGLILVDILTCSTNKKFQLPNLELPTNINPTIRDLVQACLKPDPSQRPTMTFCVEILRKCIKELL